MRKGIAHSDFDSSNIIIGSRGTPTIIDFGEAEEGGETGGDVVGLALTLVEMITGGHSAFEDGESGGGKV